jgi:hypothetical protein
MKLTVEEVAIHVNAQPCYRHDPYGIFENGDRKDGQYEEGLLPGGAKEKMLEQQARNEEGQRGVDTAALFSDLDIDSRQRKLETVPDEGYSYETE